MKKIFLILFVLNTKILFAQFTVSGKIIDKANGETLIGCNVLIQNSKKSITATTNEYGFYSLTAPEGKYIITFSYVGFEVKTNEINLNKNITFNESLVSENQLQEVILTSKKENKVKSIAIGVEKINMKDIEKLPVLFGERDVLKTIQLLPGVKGSSEGSAGFSVRGGGFDQNLILLDEAPVYNASHLLGFFSTFNSDAIKNVKLIKGNSPSEYGGRLSSVLDVKMKDGNDQKLGLSGGIGLIISKLNLEAPIQKDKSSFLISARRTYVDLFLKASEDFKNNSIYFYDLNLKANYEINDKNRVYVSGYFGRDNLALGNAFGVDWGNATATIRWNNIVNSKLFLNTSLIYSNYTYQANINSNGSKTLSSEIEDFNLKQDYQLYQNESSTIKFGFNSIYHKITPTKFEGNEVGQDLALKKSKYGFENALYLSNTYKFSSKFVVEYGARLSSYSLIGSGIYNQYNKDQKVGNIKLGNGEIGKTYFIFEPRFLSSYNLNNDTSLKFAYGRNSQNLHLLSNSSASSPTDQWIGNSYNIKPEISDQISLGYFKNLYDNKFELSIETYYKWMQNQLDYKNGAQVNSAPDIESELLYGKGRAYGLEFMLKKIKGKFTGWMSYTLSKTERKIEGINNDQWYNARQDRTHDLSLVASYDLNKKWNFSALFVYYTGNAVTFPSGKYNVNGQSVFYYNGRNQDRMPAYHRLDLSATKNLKPLFGKYKNTLNLSLYNAYGRENAYLINFEDDPNDASKTRAVQTALFKWIPSISYNFNF